MSNENSLGSNKFYQYPLPKGWVAIELQDYVDVAGRIGWKGLKSGEYTTEGPLFLAVKDILPNGRINFSDTTHISFQRYTESPQIQLRKDDILLTKDGTIGKVGMVQELPTEVTVNSSILVIRPNPVLMLPRYLFYFLRCPQFQAVVHERITGSAVPHLFQKDIKKLQVIVPPINEQFRITNTLEILLSKIALCNERLEKTVSIVRRFRKTVIDAACDGRLTAEWRSNNQNVEPAKKLLKRINAYLLKLVGKKASKQIHSFPTNFSQDANSLNIGEIPLNWVPCTIGSIGLVLSGRTPSRKSLTYWQGNIPWVSSGEVCNNKIYDTKEKLTEDGFSNNFTKMLPVGTVLLAMIGEGKTRGQTSVLKIRATINQNIAAIIIDHGLILSEYLWLWFQSKYEVIRETGNGSGPKALNCGRVRDLPFMLPPFAEQQEIVQCVESLFQLADPIESHYKKAKDYVDNFTQLILTKAFRGELVKQDPNDEAAYKLLERISAKLVDSQNKISTKENKRKGHSKTFQKAETVMLSRKDIKDTHLSTILGQRGPLTAEILWAVSQLNIDDFYDQLKAEEAQGLLREIVNDPPKISRTLEIV